MWTAQILLSLNVLAAMVWTGGLVAIAVSTIAARETMPAHRQVDFFRSLGRRWALVSGLALALFAVTGIGLAGAPGDWSSTERAVAALTLAVALLTLLGVRNARTVQRLRAQSLESRGRAGSELERARRTANLLRGLIALATLAAVLVATL
jgi:uncharacterized membrane protein